MAVKKSELYSKLWESCNTLRSKGGMDATQYKDYVLIVLFMKVITDKYCNKKDSIITVPEDANFETIINLKGKKNIGEKFNEILSKIAEENELQNIIDIVDFNDENKLGKGKDLVDALTGLVAIFQNPDLDFSNNRADDDDILGDAYEYLMKKFATESGKSKGQFYTPSEVSRVMSAIIGINKEKKGPIYVYDMTCGSGSLLLKASAEAKENVKVELYGQEKDNNTAALAVMNMFLHGNATAKIKIGNTLTNPLFIENNKIRKFDYCLANPPFSIKKWKSETKDIYNRFYLGMPPDNCADYAFLLHMLESMNEEHGKGTIILPHGVLFRGGTEEIIRKNLIERGYIEGIIGLPANLFYGTGIPACLIVLDKKDAAKRKEIFMIDASNYFIKDGNKNKLREKDIKKIIDTYLNRTEEHKYSRNVSLEEIRKEEYNLNIPRYIDSSKEEKIQDINAHLNGGIPEEDINKYNKYWNIAPKLKDELFKEISKSKYYNLKVPKDEIRKVITNSKEIKKYTIELNEKLGIWKKDIRLKLEEINNKTRVKELINTISLKILKIFQNDQLMDKYNAYQYLLEYYNETLKDDLYMIKDTGWIPTLTYAKDKNKKIRKGEFDSDLLPKQIIIDEYFSKESDEINAQTNILNYLCSEFDEIVQENTGDEQIFKEDDKINEKFLNHLLKEVSNEELTIINDLLKNLQTQKKYKKLIKELQEKLDNKVILKYKELNVDTSKSLIINNKWFKTIDNIFKEQENNLICELTEDICEEVNNYQYKLFELIQKEADLEKKVLQDLKRMGY